MAKLIQISEELELELVMTGHPVYRHISKFPAEKLVGYRAVQTPEFVTGIKVDGVDYLPVLERTAVFGAEGYRALLLYREVPTFTFLSLSLAAIERVFKKRVETKRDGFIDIWFV